MIGGVVRHGRTARDARNLAGHLLKDSLDVEVVNSAAPDLGEAMADMLLARDASRADAAFLHVYLSPSRDMTRDELRQAVEIVAEHLGAADHPMALVYHQKPRRGGEGNGHVHAVIGRIDNEGKVLPSGFDKIKVETACRLIEFELGEAPTLGRHHASAVRWMRQNGRQDVADWLEAAHGLTPPKPRSMASPDARQGMERRGVVLGTVREAVTAAWSRSDGPQAFAAAVAAEGITLAPGEKAGVWVVAKNGVEVGSLDRLLKERRKVVAERMKGFEHGAAEDRPGDRQARGGAPGRHSEAAPLAVASGRVGAEGGRPDRADSDPAGNDRHVTAPASPVAGRPAQQDRPLERAQAVRQLNQVRLSPATMQAMQRLQTRAAARPSTRFESLQASREIEASTGWDRLRELGERLLDRCRETYASVVAFRREQEQERREQQEQREHAARVAAAVARLRREREDRPEYVYSGPRM